MYLFTIYLGLRRALTFRLIFRHSIAILFAAYASAYPAPADVSLSSVHATLKIWPGAEKHAVTGYLHGERHALQAFADNIVLVHFLTTWREPCVREMTLQKLSDIEALYPTKAGGTAQPTAPRTTAHTTNYPSEETTR